MAIQSLSALTKKGWALPILAEIGAGGIARVAPMADRLGASRGATEAAFEHLIEQGILKRNAGPRHPLQSEFVLTALGRCLSNDAGELWEAAKSGGVAPSVRKRWTLPIISTLSSPSSFGGIRRDLASVSDRALSLALKNLVTEEIIVRRIVEQAGPPGTLYSLGRQGQPLAAPVMKLSSMV